MKPSNQQSLLAIDERCTRYDRNWKTTTEIFEIVGIVRDFDFPEYKAKLFVELVCIDLQKRWTLWGRDLINGIQNQALNLDLMIRSIPTSKDYLAELGEEVHVTENEVEEVRKAEFRIRHGHGDSPRPELIWPNRIPRQFVDQFKNQLVAKLFVGNELWSQQHCWGEFEIGRQADQEPNSPALIEGSSAKLVCASRSNRNISRRQVRIKTIANSCAMVSNLSRTTKFLVEQKYYLRPGESEVIRFPFRIDLSGVGIAFNWETWQPVRPEKQ